MASKVAKFTIAVCLATTAAVTSGCGHSAGTASAGDDTSVSLIQSQGVLNFAVDNVAEAEGYFKQQGLKVKINYGAGDTVTDPAVLSGGDDFGIGTTLPLFKYASSGKKPSIVAAVDDQLTQEIGINKSLAQQRGLTPGMTLAQKFARLKGHNVNVGVLDIGGSLQLTFEAIAAHYGLKEGKDFHFTAIKSYPSLILALDENRVNMVVFGMPYGSQAVEEGKSVDFTDLWQGTYQPYAGTVFGALFTSASYAKAHPATLKKMNTAINQALKFIHEQPAKALQDINKVDPGTSMSVLKSLMVTNKGAFFAQGADVDPQAYKTTQLVASQTIAPDANKIAYSDLVWSGAQPAAGS